MEWSTVALDVPYVTSTVELIFECFYCLFISYMSWWLTDAPPFKGDWRRSSDLMWLLTSFATFLFFYSATCLAVRWPFRRLSIAL